MRCSGKIMALAIQAAAMMVWLGAELNAQPAIYDLDKSASKVNFIYDFGATPVTGYFEDYTVELLLDFENVENSQVTVVFQAASVVGDSDFETHALKGELVLDAKKFPTIRFMSDNFTVTGGDIAVTGHITIRDITKPLTLNAKIDGEGEPENLHIILTGQFNRHDFGASGFKNVVGEMLTIAVDAKITRRK